MNTEEDYKETANIILKQYKYIINSSSGTGAIQMQIRLIREIAESFAKHYTEKYSFFDKDKFLKACGFGE